MRRRFIIWLWVFVIIIILAGGGVVTALFVNISTEWKAEAATAQYALNHSPLNQITRHDVFTSSGVEEVYYGLDVFHRPWYVFVEQDPYQIQTVQASGLLSSTKIVSLAKKSLKLTVDNVTIGYLQPHTQASFQTSSTVVFEVRGKNTHGQSVYAYFDARSGQLVWDYLL